MSHALFPPSASVRWLNCPGSVALTLGLPEQSSKYADEGTAAHILANRALAHSRPCSFWLDEKVTLHGHEWAFTEEMCSYVQTYVDYIHASAKELEAEVFPEQVVKLDKALGITEQFGTSDAVLLNIATGVVKITDLKYGRGEKVDASWPAKPLDLFQVVRAEGDRQVNPQLALYALGVLETITELFGPVERVLLAIVQPRLDHISEFELSVSELKEFMCQAQRAVASGMEAIVGDPTQYLKATEKGCRWCPVKADCPEMRRMVAGQLADEFEAVRPISLGLSLSARFEQLELIEQYVGAVRDAMMAAITSGNAPVGPDGRPYKLVAGRGGHRAWKDAKMAGDVLSGLVGPAAYEPASVVSPAVADKLY